ncbi:hypothetical protein VTN02DRAFT_499 [Thermoascus thermophilus]
MASPNRLRSLALFVIGAAPQMRLTTIVRSRRWQAGSCGNCADLALLRPSLVPSRSSDLRGRFGVTSRACSTRAVLAARPNKDPDDLFEPAFHTGLWCGQSP